MKTACVSSLTEQTITVTETFRLSAFYAVLSDTQTMRWKRHAQSPVFLVQTQDSSDRAFNGTPEGGGLPALV
jgi:hypothetical protein